MAERSTLLSWLKRPASSNTLAYLSFGSSTKKKKVQYRFRPIAVMTHCNERGSEMFVGDKSHIFLYEQGGAAYVSF